jgi:hypothetical protein
MSNSSVTQNPVPAAQSEVETPSSPPIISRALVSHSVIPAADAPLALVLQRLQAWDDNDDEASRPQRLAELAALLAGTNMLEIVQQLPQKFMGYAFAVPAVRERLLADPPAALAWMSAHPNVANSQLFTFLHDWGQKNQDEMSQYLVSLPDGDWKQTVMTTAAGQALSQDPVYAIVCARQMDAGQPQTSLLQMAAASWARQNPDAAVQWASQISDPALRDQMIGAIAVGYADTAPLQSMQLAGQLSSGRMADHTIADIAWKWAIQDPSGLGGYLAQMPENGGQEPVLSSLINVWANHDPAATLNWIESLSSGPLQIKAAQDMQKFLAAAAN